MTSENSAEWILDNPFRVLGGDFYSTYDVFAHKLAPQSKYKPLMIRYPLINYFFLSDDPNTAFNQIWLIDRYMPTTYFSEGLFFDKIKDWLISHAEAGIKITRTQDLQIPEIFPLEITETTRFEYYTTDNIQIRAVSPTEEVNALVSPLITVFNLAIETVEPGNWTPKYGIFANSLWSDRELTGDAKELLSLEGNSWTRMGVDFLSPVERNRWRHLTISSAKNNKWLKQTTFEYEYESITPIYFSHPFHEDILAFNHGAIGGTPPIFIEGAWWGPTVISEEQFIEKAVDIHTRKFEFPPTPVSLIFNDFRHLYDSRYLYVQSTFRELNRLIEEDAQALIGKDMLLMPDSVRIKEIHAALEAGYYGSGQTNEVNLYGEFIFEDEIRFSDLLNQIYQYKKDLEEGRAAEPPKVNILSLRQYFALMINYIYGTLGLHKFPLEREPTYVEPQIDPESGTVTRGEDENGEILTQPIYTFHEYLIKLDQELQSKLGLWPVVAYNYAQDGEQTGIPPKQELLTSIAGVSADLYELSTRGSLVGEQTRVSSLVIQDQGFELVRGLGIAFNWESREREGSCYLVPTFNYGASLSAQMIALGDAIDRTSSCVTLASTDALDQVGIPEDNEGRRFSSGGPSNRR